MSETIPCPQCSGTGEVESPDSLFNALRRIMRRQYQALTATEVRDRLAIEYPLAQVKAILDDLEVCGLVKSNQNLLGHTVYWSGLSSDHHH